jgi:hypothetical protein
MDFKVPDGDFMMSPYCLSVIPQGQVSVVDLNHTQNAPITPLWHATFR